MTVKKWVILYNKFTGYGKRLEEINRLEAINRV